MVELFDVAVVGGRVAGAITAALLGDAGHRVIVIDAASFPSDTISTHFFRGAGLVSVLARLGVLDEVLARGALFSFLGDELVYAFPSDDDVTCLAISINLDAFATFRRSPEAMFDGRVRAHRSVGARFDAARAEGRLLGSGPKDAVIREARGPGWALVGDAGLHQDPWTGFGMDYASIQAAFLAEATDEWLRCRKTETQALATDQQRRDEHATPGFDFTASAGRDLSAL